MRQGVNEKSRSLLFLGLIATYIIRWVASLGVAILLFWFMSGRKFLFSSSDVAEEGLFDEGISPMFDSDIFFKDLMTLATVIFIGFAINSLISCFAVTHLGRKNNRLWAFIALMIVPFLVIGVLAGFSPISDAVNPLSILLSAMVVDLVMVAIIGWRMAINRSPFEGMNLIDNSEYVWEEA